MISGLALAVSITTAWLTLFRRGDARIVNRSAAVLLSNPKLSLTEEHAAALRNKTMGVLFTWGPDAGRYHASISSAPLRSLPANAD